MHNRSAVALASTALVVSLFGATPLGDAAGKAITSVPPFAKRAGFATRAGFAQRAKLADTATQAKLVVGHRISTAPKPGDIPVVGSDGKLPAALGAVGPPGPPGAQGPQGAAGNPGLVRAYAHILADGSVDQSKGSKGIVSARTNAAGMCVKLDPSIDALRAIPSVTPDIAGNFSAGANGSIAYVAVINGGCTGSNEIHVYTGSYGAGQNGGTPVGAPGPFYLLVP
jgi:hypothetical protein